MGKTSLRPYQIMAINGLYQAIKEGHKRIILALPTGGGKSTVTAAVVYECVKYKKKVGFIVHSKELVVQFAQRLWNQFGIRSGIIMSGVETTPAEPVQVSSLMTLVRRKVPDCDIIFIDECHRSKANSYQKIIEQYPDAILVGLTATPLRPDRDWETMS